MALRRASCVCVRGAMKRSPHLNESIYALIEKSTSRDATARRENEATAATTAKSGVRPAANTAPGGVLSSWERLCCWLWIFLLAATVLTLAIVLLTRHGEGCSSGVAHSHSLGKRSVEDASSSTRTGGGGGGGVDRHAALAATLNATLGVRYVRASYVASGAIDSGATGQTQHVDLVHTHVVASVPTRIDYAVHPALAGDSDVRTRAHTVNMSDAVDAGARLWASTKCAEGRLQRIEYDVAVLGDGLVRDALGYGRSPRSRAAVHHALRAFVDHTRARHPRVLFNGFESPAFFDAVLGVSAGRRAALLIVELEVHDNATASRIYDVYLNKLFTWTSNDSALRAGVLDVQTFAANVFGRALSLHLSDDAHSVRAATYRGAVRHLAPTDRIALCTRLTAL